MLRRLFHRLVFVLERFLVRGALNQLLFIAALIALVSVVSGSLLFLAVPDADDYFEAVWWGFLRLSDPGYLGDDKGAIARTISTVVTVLGYVLFMGALVAIMTQGLGRTLRRLESGRTPITQKGHVLILGWTNRTVAIIRELLLSQGRVRRFLRALNMNKLRIVVMAEEVTTELVYELRTSLGDLWDPNILILRSGSPLQIEHLARVDFLNAAAIILPAGDFTENGPESFDARIIKTILSISSASEGQNARTAPILTTELFDSKKITIARAAYVGDIEIVPSSTVISRLIAQNVRHSGLSNIYAELLTHDTGNEIYVRVLPELTGRQFHELGVMFSRAIPLGIIRVDGDHDLPLMNPGDDLTVEENDRLIFLAENYDAITPDASASDNSAPTDFATTNADPPARPPVHKKVLILGWSNKLPALLTEFESYTGESFSITLASRVSRAERQAFIQHSAGDLNHVEITYVEADHTSPQELKNLHPEDYDNIVFLASDWLASEEEADSRTILGLLLLRTIIPSNASKPEVLAELMASENHTLFSNRPGETLISPLIMSHLMAQITLRRDMSLIFEELFTSEGAEIYFLPPRHYGLEARSSSFRAIQRLVAAKGDIALGIYQRRSDGAGAGKLHLNPPRASEWSLSTHEEIVVLTTYNQTEVHARTEARSQYANSRKMGSTDFSQRPS